MEPVTHVLTGACLARTGLNRRAAYATAAMAIAAEFPDIDTLWGLRGPVSGFEHHRGITHTLLGVPIEAAVILLGFIAYHRVRAGRQIRVQSFSGASTGPGSRTGLAPVSWGVLYLLVVLALLSHLWLDYTNNYGLRPFFPFDGRWISGSFVFIFDPLLLLLLITGLLAPVFFGLIGREVGAKRERFRGRGWARAALAGAILLWSVRWVEHNKAVEMAQAQNMRAPGEIERPSVADANETAAGVAGTQSAPDDRRALLQPQRSLASPDPLSLFMWYTVTDYGPAYRLGVADVRVGAFSPGEILNKPVSNPAIRAAESSDLGRFYLNWSPMPALSLASGVPGGFGDSAADGSVADQTVTFSDPRFIEDTPWLHREDQIPLTGQVVLDQHGTVIGEAVDGRFGR